MKDLGTNACLWNTTCVTQQRMSRAQHWPFSRRACLRYFRYGGTRKQFNRILEICIWLDKHSHVKKPLSQALGQWWFYHTNCQLTEKVSGRLFPNWYQENCLLMTHLFVYEQIFVMILWTVPQSHPFPQSANQLCSCQEAFMGTKMYSGYQNILFTTPWNMSPKASRFHFEHYVSLQDWSPPNLVSYQNICNCLDLYQMKSDSKILNWATLPGAPQMTLSSFLNLYQKCFCLVAILHDTQQSAIWQLNISRNLANVDNISCHYRYNNTFLWCCFDMKNSIFHTSLIIHRFWSPIYEKNFIMLCTTLTCTIPMMIFNITATLWKQIIQLKAVWISKREI